MADDRDLQSRIGTDTAKAALSAIREAGLIIVPGSPTGSMTKAARRCFAAEELDDADIENIYFLMTNEWLTS